MCVCVCVCVYVYIDVCVQAISEYYYNIGLLQSIPKKLYLKRKK